LLADLGTVVVIASAPNGQTFDGSGTLLGYVFSNSVWVRAPNSDLSMTDGTGLASVQLPSLPVVSPRDRFALIPSGVGLSGGAVVTLDFRCTSRLGEAI
jgi:hypothetical protein